VTVTQIERLAPQRSVILGGTAAVSAAVELKLRELVGAAQP
jgi:putative cell wall-binding protein